MLRGRGAILPIMKAGGRSRRIRALLADEQVLIRRGVASLLADEADFDVVGEASSGQQAIERARELMPDLILMDVNIPGLNGLETIRQIKQFLPHAKVVMLTESEDRWDIQETIRSGVHGYLLKRIEPRVLADTLRSVMRGKRPFPKTSAGKPGRAPADGQNR